MAKGKTRTVSHPSTALVRAETQLARLQGERSAMTRGRGRGRRRGGGGRRGQSSEKVLMALVVGGFAMGYIDKPGGLGTNIPTIPILGKAGTIALAAHFFAKGKAGIVTDIRNAAAVVAAYEFGSTGRVAGDEV